MLKVHTTNGPNVAVLCVQGRIVRGETEVLRNAVLAQRKVSLVVLDLARVSMIDAGGLGLLLELRQHTESSGIEIRLKNVTKLVRQVLEITRLDTVFDISMGKDLPVAPLNQRRRIWLRQQLLRKREGVKDTA
jgi:anti-sigma B factor antagonist